jgi:hypothetical protein
MNPKPDNAMKNALAARWVANTLRTFTDAQMLAGIARYQAIQRTSPPTSEEWQCASLALRPMFAEMARRYPAGTGPGVQS